MYLINETLSLYLHMSLFMIHLFSVFQLGVMTRHNLINIGEYL